MGEKVAVIVEVFVDEPALAEELGVDGEEDQVFPTGVERTGDTRELLAGRAVDEAFRGQARR